MAQPEPDLPTFDVLDAPGTPSGAGGPRLGFGILTGGELRRRRPDIVIATLVLGAGLGGTLAGTHATGTPVIDPLYAALAAGLVTLAASRANRETQLILGMLAAALSRGWMLVPGAGSLMVAFGSIWIDRRRLPGALTGALAMQAVLRWPRMGFQGLTLLIGIVAIAPVLVSANRQLRPESRRRTELIGLAVAGGLVVLAVPLAAGAVISRRVVSGGATAAQLALDGAGAANSAVVASQLRSASAAFSTAHRDTAGWWTLGSAVVPIVAQHRHALARATAQADQLTRTAANQATSLDYHNLSYHQGLLDLTRLSAMAQPLATLDRHFLAAHRELLSLRSAWLLPPLQSRLDALGSKLDRARAAIDLAAQAAEAAPGILGGEAPRHYFVAFMTPAESRGLDGFIGSFGELVADRGRITLVRSGPIGELQQAPMGTRHISGPADYLARYGPFHPQDLFQDLSYSPDFPAVADVIAQMYPQSGGGPIDGVLAIDPVGLGALLSFTGPVTIPGLPGPVTSENAAEVLLKDQYIALDRGSNSTTRHDLLQEAVAIAFPKLLAGSLPGPRALGQHLAPAVRQGRLLFWTSHADDQPLLKRLGLDGGATPSVPGDYLAVTTQNGGNNKLDAYLQRSVDDRVSVDPGTGHVTAKVTITLHNSAPSNGLPPIVAGSFAGSGLPPATNRTWLSIYTPLGLTGATVEGSARLVASTPELGVNTYSTFVDIARGKTVTITVSLSGQVPIGPRYSLQVRLQPLAGTEHYTFVVTPTAGWIRRDPATWTPNSDQRQIHAVGFRRSR